MDARWTVSVGWFLWLMMIIMRTRTVKLGGMLLSNYCLEIAVISATRKKLVALECHVLSIIERLTSKALQRFLPDSLS